MEKGIEISIYETKEIIKQVIAESHLNVSVVEMILKDFYLETSSLAEQNLRRSLQKWNEEKQHEEEIQNDNK